MLYIQLFQLFSFHQHIHNLMVMFSNLSILYQQSHYHLILFYIYILFSQLYIHYLYMILDLIQPFHLLMQMMFQNMFYSNTYIVQILEVHILYNNISLQQNYHYMHLYKDLLVNIRIHIFYFLIQDSFFVLNSMNHILFSKNLQFFHYMVHTIVQNLNQQVLNLSKHLLLSNLTKNLQLFELFF